MRYIKRFESFSKYRSHLLKNGQPTEMDINKIKDVIGSLIYILEDGGFRHDSSFENTDIPTLFIYKKYIDGQKSPGNEWTPTDSNRYYYPKNHTISEEIMEFIDRLDEELDGFKIKINNFTQYIGLLIIKQ